METVGFNYDLSQHGIDKVIKIQLRSVVNGKTPEQQFPRDTIEQQELNKIILKELEMNKASVVNNAASLGELRKNMINDPIGTMIKKKAADAVTSPGNQGINLGTTLKEITELLPFGNEFEPKKAGQGIINTAAKLMSGTSQVGSSAGEVGDLDPKQMITDVGVIATDLALAGQLTKDFPNNTFTTRNAIFNQLKKNPALGFASVVATNVAAKQAGDAFYDLSNKLARYIMELPDPEEAYKKNENIRNMIDARTELMWTGGAMGLQHVFPLVKRMVGKNIFKISDDLKLQVGEIRNPETGLMEPINENMLALAKQYNIPMNVFSTSPSSFVKGAGSVIGLFPFVATSARQAQNAQQVASAREINSTLNNLSPIGLFSDSNVVATKSFKTMINKFTSTKTALYKRALRIGDEINDDFLPTHRIKEIAENLELETYGGKRPKGNEGSLRLNQPDYDRPQDVDSLLAGFIGKQTDYVDALIDMQYLKKDFISAREFKKLQTQFNALKRKAAADSELGTELGGVDNFTKAMIHTLDDFENFKQFDDPAKKALVNQFSGAMGIANNFFFNNVNYTKGRVAQILGLADKNIAKATEDIDPTMLTGEQVLKILFNDETLYSPAAIKEMKTAMPPVKLANGKIVDPVAAVARTYIDDQLRETTKYISGSLKYTGQSGMIGGTFKKGASWLSGKEEGVKQASANFNIPIIDVQALKKSFGLDNPNKMEAMQEIFGKEQYERMRNIVALGDTIQQTNFGDVSAFVKRRGFLGGINAITNLAFAGFVANNPFGNIGYVLMARYGMSKMADPKFMEGLTKTMNPELSDMARRQALINTIALTPELSMGMSEGKEDVPSELQNLDTGNPYDVMKYMIFMSNNNVTYPGSENMEIQIGPDGFAQDVKLSKVDSKNEFSIDSQGVANDLQEMEVSTATESVEPSKDPFLNVDFDQMIQNTGVGMGTEAAQKQLSEEQRVALASGNLDQAIAMGSRRG